MNETGRLPNGRFDRGNPGSGLPGPGRPSNKALKEFERAKETVFRMFRKNVMKIGKTYVALATGEAIETEKG